MSGAMGMTLAGARDTPAETSAESGGLSTTRCRGCRNSGTRPGGHPPASLEAPCKRSARQRRRSAESRAALYRRIQGGRALLEGTIPALSAVLAQKSVAEFVDKVRSGAPVFMGDPPMHYRGRMPAFDYLKDRRSRPPTRSSPRFLPSHSEGPMDLST